MSVTIWRGDAGRLPLADGSVDLIVTSPPYFAMRRYADRGEHYAGQLGSEPSPAAFVDALVEVTRELVRVLAPGGSLWVNLGDKYCGYTGPAWGHGRNPGGGVRGECLVPVGGPESAPGAYGIPNKSLMGLPWRYAIACTDRLGLILRRDQIWHKTSSMPDSGTDRTAQRHEYFFHFVKEARYYSATDEIREPTTGHAGTDRKAARDSHGGGNHRELMRDPDTFNPLGRIPGSVWTVAAQPLVLPECRLVTGGRTVRWFPTWRDGWAHMAALARDPATAARIRAGSRPSLRAEIKHSAAFPPNLIRPIVLGWSPARVCLTCGQGRRPVSTTAYTEPAVFVSGNGTGHRVNRSPGRGSAVVTIGGYACACTPYTDHPERRGTDWHDQTRAAEHGRNAGDGRARKQRWLDELENPRGPVREYHFAGWTPPPSRPGRVLDPFSGTGTTAMVADVLGRDGLAGDMSGDYCRAARWRTAEPAERARAMGVPRPPPVPANMEPLF